jgi:catabolite regulation protein CreA
LMQKSGLVYTVVSTKLIAGSPFNSINVVLPGCDKPVLAQDRR